FIAAAAKCLPQSDVWCILYPSLRHLLRSDVKESKEQSLLSAMKPPVSLRPSASLSTASFLFSTLKPKAADKRALSNSAKEATRKWGQLTAFLS
ncbi:hypothetical protein CY34DRAFT_756993, partial [Suillus luteus UH-Slu-Lm8-n1]